MLNRCPVVVVAGALVALTVAAVPASAQSVVPASVQRAPHIAVGSFMSNAPSLPPFMRNTTNPALTVEATEDGWVYVSVLNSADEPSMDVPPIAPPTQLIVEGRDAHRWATLVRDAFRQPDTSVLRALPQLGRGANTLRFSLGAPNSGGTIGLGCPRGNFGRVAANSADFLKVVDLLDSAAIIAGLREARPPTLSRPYYPTELSCAAFPSFQNATPSVPATANRAKAVGATFVVDTAGRVETGSIRIFPGVDRIVADRVRATVATWRFDPAEWDGTPVRQFVQTTVSLTRKAPPVIQKYDGTSRLTVTADDDGWVLIRTRDDFDRSVQEYYTPDDVDRWVESLDAPRPNRTAVLGTLDAVQVAAGFGTGRDSLQLHTVVRGCTNGALWSAIKQVPLTEFTRAAMMARQNRSSPRLVPGRVYEAGEVACPAVLAWQPVTARTLRGVVRFPRAAYPKEMASVHARVEALVSFVVDSTGRPELRSLVVAPGIDKRAKSHLAEAVRGLRFTPAVRAGQRVSQRVFHTVYFEPPPICSNLGASPFCPRRYSER